MIRQKFNKLFSNNSRAVSIVFIFGLGLLFVALGLIISPNQEDPDKMYPGDWVTFFGFIVIIIYFVYLVIQMFRGKSPNNGKT